MPILTQEELKSVVAAGHKPAVSIYLPTHRAGPEIRQDPIRLKNLVRQAEAELIKEGTRPAEAQELLAPISQLVEDAAFWRRQEDGLAIFRSQEAFRIYRVPLAVREFVAVSDRFHIKPLLPLLINDAQFYILALSQKAVRLLECSRDHVRDVELPDVPQGTQEGLAIGPAPEFQRYTLPVGGPHAGRLHGHGVGIDDADVTNLTRYFHRIDDGVSEILKRANAPLILACVEYLAPIYREASSYRHIIEPIIPGNPDGLTNEDLHHKGWPIAEQHFKQARDKAAAQYHEGVAKGRAAHTLTEILPAAYQGRIATLFFPLGVRRWGRFDFDRLSLEEHDAEQPGDDELLDLAAMQTLMHGGTVYGVQPEDVPGQRLLAAVYRF
ncbi:MAG TPA: hypothetical protein VHF07_01165 [Nitrospiraceae bacterium]|nr:hypothetical protein [Nitrospiraceae bacterium]